MKTHDPITLGRYVDSNFADWVGSRSGQLLHSVMGQVELGLDMLTCDRQLHIVCVSEKQTGLA